MHHAYADTEKRILIHLNMIWGFSYDVWTKNIYEINKQQVFVEPSLLKKRSAMETFWCHCKFLVFSCINYISAFS
jgi:hypothetical protein